MDALLMLHSNIETPLIKSFIKSYEKSRKKETMLDKFQKEIELKYNI